MHENWGEKLIISSDLGYVYNILTLPSIICADKQSGGCKISSRYFRKMFSIPRYWTYRPIPTFYLIGQSPLTVLIQLRNIYTFRTFRLLINAVILLLNYLVLILCLYMHIFSRYFLLHCYITHTVSSESLQTFILFHVFNNPWCSMLFPQAG